MEKLKPPKNTVYALEVVEEEKKEIEESITPSSPSMRSEIPWKEPNSATQTAEGDIMLHFVRDIQSIFKGNRGCYIQGSWAYLFQDAV